MFPLITGEREVTGLLDLWEEAKLQLAERGMTWSESIEMGIMIETPAAAILSDRLATMVDFFSIGTNDLTQYTLAMDRQNAALSEMSQGRQESVLRLIRYTVQSARRAGIWVGVCGEIAADVTMTKELLDMGVTELSVSPGGVLALRERICTMPADSAGLEDEKEENYGHFQGK
jgi:phosphotransferase system enzyme I (PtsI)